ncbi:hypothetical protein J2X36_000978 [Methylobacterium sp. BE186]|uniref:hypothetical protein n=1 Tax=Methylobacterium sp. BE186 TaxID=2817715 RepID=UPI002865CC38|nr:hypothetical protein [Methylobacterium sp. BE186]MDR7036240.1 hypothetical protein [Methylobacterium sp. BE186]
MRLLRALARLVLALALVTAAGAHAPSSAAPADAAHRHPDHHATAHATAAGIDCAAQGHHSRGDKHPAPGDDGCRTACCFVAGYLPGRPEASEAAFFRTLRFAIVAQPMSGRHSAPDPEIPKRAA